MTAVHTLVARDVSKRFGERRVFSGLSFELSTGEALAVVGPNGSGKSTLLLTLLSFYRPTRGSIAFGEDGRGIGTDEMRRQVALVAPYLNLYDGLTAEENLTFFTAASGVNITGRDINRLLDRVGLEGRGHDLVSAYSSGMKQRLKYALALSRQPAYLFLDEPTSNLDESGRQMVLRVVEECRPTSVIVLATNQPEEAALAARQCRLG